MASPVCPSQVVSYFLSPFALVGVGAAGSTLKVRVPLLTPISIGICEETRYFSDFSGADSKNGQISKITRFPRHQISEALKLDGSTFAKPAF